MESIYVLSTCDEWKSCNSMKRVLVTTSMKKLKRGILELLKKKVIEYKRGNDGLSMTKQIAMLREDWSIQGETFVFSNLDYGYVDICEDGYLDN